MERSKGKSDIFFLSLSHLRSVAAKNMTERVFIDYQLSVINNHDENVITTNVILLSSLLRNESSNGAARCAARVFGKNILRLRRNGNGTKRNEALRNVAECSEVERRSKLFFPFAEQE